MIKSAAEYLAGEPRSTDEADCCFCIAGVQSLIEDLSKTLNSLANCPCSPSFQFHTPRPDIATCMYYTGIDPFTKQEGYVARGLRDRKMQRALMQFFKPENWFTVREALIQAGRQDLIGSGCDCLIPAQPPREAVEARRRRAHDPDHYHTVANPAGARS